MIRPAGRPLVDAVVAEPVVGQLGGSDEIDALEVERLGAAVTADEVSVSAARRAVVVILNLEDVSRRKSSNDAT